MVEWEEQYNKQLTLRKSLKDALATLRFEKKTVSPSEIGSQAYCEKKVELAYIYGTTETREMVIGTEGHDKVIEDFEKVDLEQIWQCIYQKDWCWIAETPFVAKYKDVYIAGVPDQVLFIKAKPFMLFEFKFSKYHASFPSQHIQAQAYGIELKELGFDTSSLFYAIIVCPLKKHEALELKALPKQIINTFLKKELFTQESCYLTFNDVNIYINQFDAIKAESNLDWAVEYWKQEREAKSTDNPNKCKSCEFNQQCDRKNATLSSTKKKSKS